jgi:hypothetical protein
VSGCGGIDGVGLAVAAGGPVGPVDLHDGDVVPAQAPAQRGSVGAGVALILKPVPDRPDQDWRL